MKLRNIVALAFSLLLAAPALAQNTLPPTLSGTNSEHRKEMFEAGMFRLNPLNAALTALSGGAQSGATPLNMGFNRFTTVAASGDSAILPTVDGAVQVVVVNASSNPMNVYPPTGGTINALSANTAFSLAAGKTIIFFQAASGVWYGNLSA